MTQSGFLPESTALLDKGDKLECPEKSQKVHIASRSRKCAVFLSCIMQLIMCSGVGYGLSVMYAELVIVFDAKRADAAWVQSLYAGISCGSGIFFTGMITKLGEGICIAVGGLLSAVGLFVSALGDDLVPIIICTGIFAGVTMGVCYLAAYIVIGKLFTEHLSFYLITLTLGISIGQFIVPLLFELFIANLSWSGAFILMAGVSLQCVPCGLVIHYSQRYYSHQAITKTTDTTNTLCDNPLLTDRIIWIVLFNFLLNCITGNVEAWFIVDHMISRGFARESGSITVSMIGVGSCVGRIIGALIRYRFAEVPSINHWIYLCLFSAVLHAVIFNLYDYWPILITCLLFGIVFGTTFSLTPAIMFEATGLEKYPQGMGLVNIALGLGDIVGPLFGGFIKDVTGTYEICFYLSTGVGVYISICTVVVAFCFKQRQHRIDSSSYIRLQNDSTN